MGYGSKQQYELLTSKNYICSHKKVIAQTNIFTQYEIREVVYECGMIMKPFLSWFQFWKKLRESAQKSSTF